MSSNYRRKTTTTTTTNYLDTATLLLRSKRRLEQKKIRSTLERKKNYLSYVAIFYSIVRLFLLLKQIIKERKKNDTFISSNRINHIPVKIST